ncbi:nicotinate (nicotinamide) nucleotide adenylyltransferase [Oscillospiraceae bacterium OttesenSCG-928-G22]|nr:nicotinate (nicotinamide) nucleotide adenylyltransferase [Oscillospiraceae bacterium OttesenSCG-928-G22]
MAERIGLFGGTFNPPHLGHVQSVEYARRELGLSRILVVPAGIPPHKALPFDTAPPEDRLTMTKLAFSGLDFCDVSDMELTRGGTSYTVDTLWELHERDSDAVITLLVGGDMFLSLHTWFKPEELFALASIGVFSRKASEQAEIKAHAGFLMERFGATVHIIDAPVLEISSTELRLRVRSGGSVEGLLPESVKEYILHKGLYRSEQYDS